MDASSEEEDPWSLFGSTLSSSTATGITHEWVGSLGEGADEWDDDDIRLEVDEETGSMNFVVPSGLPSHSGPADLGTRPEVSEIDSQPPGDTDRGPQLTGRAAVFHARLTGAASDLREARREMRGRVDRAFWTCLGFGVVGGAAVLTGAGFLIAGAVAPGVPSTIGGVVSSVTSRIFYRLYDQEDENLKTYFSDLRVVERARLGLMLANQISDSDARNRAIRELVEDIEVSAVETEDESRENSND